MADIVSKIKRGEIMSRVRGKETKPEIAIRKYLFSNGFRYRKNVKRLPGTPDIVLPKYKVVIFVNGCFWHGHESCKLATIPKTRTDFWLSKIKTNIERDAEKNNSLMNLGWRVILIWQCEIKNIINQSRKDSYLIKSITQPD